MEIKNHFTGEIIFAGEAATLKDLVATAIKEGKSLSGADLSGADLRRANLRGADLRRANLRGADLSGADLSGADLRRANLRGADLSGANLSGADLSGADLSGADLSGADLSGADLSGADLSGADLRRADLRRANLRGANLSGADLSGADLSGADLSGADLSRAYLRGADLSGADLSRAYLRGADLSRADLRRAKGVIPERVCPLLFLLDQPGPIRAYKMTTADGKSPMCQSSGGTPIQYEVSASYEVADANTDPNVQCAAGISLSTLDWCLKEWQPGYRVFLAEFTAADIACIPTATDGKFRVRRCKIVAEKDISALVKKD